MGAICNGLALCGLRAYAGTFLVFSDYMRPSIRLAAMMGLPILYIFTHDSIGVGEDGPTHQPVEQLAALRAIPHLLVIRPADANEVAEAYRVALGQRKRPVALILTRQDLPTLDRSKYAGGLRLCGVEPTFWREASSGQPQAIVLGQRQRGAHLPGCPRNARGGGDSDPRRKCALLGTFRRAIVAVPAVCFAGRGQRAGWEWRPGWLSDGTATLGPAGGSWG